MPRIKPVHWKVLECVFLMAGFVLERHKGASHRMYTNPGVLRPVIIPAYNEINVDIIKANMRSTRMARDEYFTSPAKYY